MTPKKTPRLVVALVLLVSALVYIWLGTFRDKSTEQAGLTNEPFSPETETGSWLDPLILGAIPDSVPTVAIEDFENWMARYINADASIREMLIEEGVAIALRRLSELKTIIREDPETALALAIPYEIRRILPSLVLDQLETPVSAFAQYELLVYCPASGQEGGGLERLVSIGEEDYEVFTYGRRLDVTAKDRLSIHGIAIDDVMAIKDDPIRVLTEAEKLDRGIISEIVVSVGGVHYQLSDPEALIRLRHVLEEDEALLGPRSGISLQDIEVDGVTLLLAEEPGAGFSFDDLPELQSAHTEGPKTMLYIRARFSDQAANYEPNDLATLMERQMGCEAFWFENSYGKSTLTTTFTDVISLPNSASYYADQTSGRLNTLYGDVLPLVKTAGEAKGQDWDEANYDFYTMITTGGSWGYAGVANVGGRRSHLNGAGSSNIRTASHEFGHNLGLLHANYWRTDSTSPIGRDSIPGGYVGDSVRDERIEYGHKFSVMGAQNGGGDLNEGRGHYTSGEKVRLDWLVSGDGDWVSIDQTTETPIRLYRQDVESGDFGSMTTGVARAIKINADSGDYAETNKRRYWLSYRRLPTNGIAGTWLPHGLQVDWQRENYGGDGSILLDMTPYSNDDSNENPTIRRDNSDKEDAVVVVGRTYSDEISDIHFTPIAQGGDNPNEWLDVIVNIGTQHENSPPRISFFEATANSVDENIPVSIEVDGIDDDGDSLYYSWTFGDNNFPIESLNSKVVSKSWSDGGFYPVRVTVSDGKGGSDSREVIIRVGTNAEPPRIDGRVVHGGLPVQGARVSVEDGLQAWTDGNGKYVLVSTFSEINDIKVAKDGLSFEPLFTNPVFVRNQDATGRDWVASQNGAGTGSIEMILTPFETVVPLGIQHNYLALAWDSDGFPISVNPTWSVSGGGTIDESGVFTANEIGGPFEVTATFGTIEAQALVKVENISAVGVVALKSQVSEPGGVPETVFRFKRYGSVAERLSVRFNMSGAAIDGEDFWREISDANFIEGESEVDMVLHIQDDFESEGVEDVVVTLLPDSDYVIYSREASAFAQILDDGDRAPEIQITSPMRTVAFVPAGIGLLVEAEVSDDGFPDPPGESIISWSVLESPEGSIVLFSPPQGNASAVTFSEPGFYRIQLTARDGVNSGFAELGVYAGLSPISEPSSRNEILYYSMEVEEGLILTDQRGQDNNGMFANGLTWEDATDGISGSGIRLDGIDDRIDIADSEDINLLDHSLRTISLWFKADDPNKEAFQVLYEEGGNTRGLNIYLHSGRLFMGGWDEQSNSWDGTYISTKLTNTEWHHIALILSAEVSLDLQLDTFKGYLDGVEFGSGSATTLEQHGGDIAIGGKRDATRYHTGVPLGTGDNFAGIIDEFHLWNLALLPTELGQLFGRGYVGPQIGLSTVVPVTSGSQVVPPDMGLVLRGKFPDEGILRPYWTEVMAPEGGSATIAEAYNSVALVKFSKNGFYKIRYAADDGLQKSAVDVNVHYGLDAGANPVIEGDSTYFNFDEGSGPSAGNSGYDEVQLLLSEKATWTTSEGGVSGSAILIRNAQNFQMFSGRTQIEESGRKKSFALWFRPDALGTGSKEVIFEVGGEGNGFNIYLEGDVLYAGNWGRSRDGWQTYLTSEIEREQWHHICLVLDVESFDAIDPDGLRVYLDGAFTGFGNAGNFEGASRPGLGGVNFTTVFHDGGLFFDQLFPFWGHIDEFHYYNNHALSIDEVGMLYAFGNVGPTVDAGADQLSESDLMLTLVGGAVDDGRWQNPFSYEWMVSGRPGAGDFHLPDQNKANADVLLVAGGTFELALAAFDGQVTTFDSKIVSINQPTMFDVFMEDYPSIASEERDYLANPDNDLWTNIEEYGFGGAPDGSGTGNELWIKSELVREGEVMYFEFRFPRRLDAALRGLSYELQFSNNLLSNQWGHQAYTEVGTSVIDENFEEVRLRVDAPIQNDNTPLFGRVRLLLKE